jgi:hypothetical protein
VAGQSRVHGRQRDGVPPVPVPVAVPGQRPADLEPAAMEKLCIGKTLYFIRVISRKKNVVFLHLLKNFVSKWLIL